MLVDVLPRLSIDLPRIELPPGVYDYLRGHAIPEDIIADLAACSFAEWISIGPLSLVPMPNIIEQTSGISACIEHGYMAIAGGANGDPVAVHNRTRRVVFVSHELLWSDDGKAFEECIHPTPFAYEEFWEQVVSDENFPWDYYAARDRWPLEQGGLSIRRAD